MSPAPELRGAGGTGQGTAATVARPARLGAAPLAPVSRRFVPVQAHRIAAVQKGAAALQPDTTQEDPGAAAAEAEGAAQQTAAGDARQGAVLESAKQVKGQAGSVAQLNSAIADAAAEVCRALLLNCTRQ